MNAKESQKFRELLLDQLKIIEKEDQLGLQGQQTVELDQQAVGRLSRMDALQNQAMAKASQARRNTMRLRIAAALERLDEGEFGYCVDCGEEVPIKRISLDPTTPKCLSCAAG